MKRIYLISLGAFTGMLSPPLRAQTGDSDVSIKTADIPMDSTRNVTDTLSRAKPAPDTVVLYQMIVQGHRPITATNDKTFTDQALSLRMQTDPADIIKVVPGLLTGQHAGGGKANQYFIRGFDADHGTDLALWLDGMPINLVSHAHGQGFADLHFIIPEWVNEVQVTKGPFDIKYGDLATGGLSWRHPSGLYGSFRFQNIGGRAGDSTYSDTAYGYTVCDLGLGYRYHKWEFAVDVGNLFNAKWYTAQFETTTRLRDPAGNLEPAAITDMAVVPGAPVNIKGGIKRYF